MRRELLTIFGITALVVVLVLVLGPLFNGHGGTKDTSSNRAASVPKFDTAESATEEREVPATVEPGEIRLKPVDQITRQILLRARAEVSVLFSESISIGGSTSAATDDIRMSVPAGVYRVVVLRKPYLRWTSAPVRVMPGQTVDLGEVALTPVFDVTISPHDEEQHRGSVRITRTWPPLRVEGDQPQKVETVLQAGRRLHLVPGRYECRPLPDPESPYVMIDQGRAPSYEFDRSFKFEVKDGPMRLQPVFETEAGSQSLAIQVRNLDGDVPRPNWVWAVAHRPPLHDRIVAAALTDANGQAELTGLHYGEFTLVAGREVLAGETPSAVVHVRLTSAEVPSIIQLSIREHGFDGETTWQAKGGLQIQVTKQGEPAEGVSVIDLDAERWPNDQGSIIGVTDAAGQVSLDATGTGTRHFRFGRQSLRVLEVVVHPGEPTKIEVEQCPEGTSVLKAKLNLARRRINHVSALTGVGYEPTVNLSVSDEGEFVVLDAPFGYLVFEAVVDRDHLIEFGVEISAESETEWSSGLDLQPLEAKLPEEVGTSSRLVVSLRGPQNGDRWNFYGVHAPDVEDGERVVKLIDLRPGRYQLRLSREQDLWISESFVVLNVPVRITGWEHTEGDSEYRTQEMRDVELIKVSFRVPVQARPPWTTSLRASFSFGSDDEPTDRSEPMVGTLDDRYELRVSLPRRAQWLDVRVGAMEPERIDLSSSQSKTSGSRSLQLADDLRPIGGSRLIWLQLDGDSSAVGPEFWRMQFRFNGEALTSWRSLSTPSSLFAGGVEGWADAGVNLVTWQGRLALWLPELENTERTLELSVPGFKGVSLDLQNETTGYLELPCELKRPD